jgi:hypothetical protein
MTTLAEVNRQNREFYGQQPELRTPIPYEKRLVAYIDIIGWSEACRNPDKHPKVVAIAQRISDLPKNFSKSLKDKLKTTPGVADDATHQETEVVTFSDNLAISTPVGLDYVLFFKFITIVCRDLLTQGFLTRGGVTLGDLCHVENMIFGPALIDAVCLEKEASYPRLVCSHTLVEYIKKLQGFKSDPPEVIINQGCPAKS